MCESSDELNLEALFKKEFYYDIQKSMDSSVTLYL